MTKGFRSLKLGSAVLLLCGCGGPERDPGARAAAEWALRRGGVVRVVNMPREIGDMGRLPGGGFALEAIDMNDLPADQPPVRDGELKVLEGLTNLATLGLYGSDVGDEGAETIAKIESLRELELSQTQITDKGLESLGALPNLERVFLRNVGDRISADAVKQFEQRTGAQVFR